MVPFVETILRMFPIRLDSVVFFLHVVSSGTINSLSFIVASSEAGQEHSRKASNGHPCDALCSSSCKGHFGDSGHKRVSVSTVWEDGTILLRGLMSPQNMDGADHGI